MQVFFNNIWLIQSQPRGQGPLPEELNFTLKQVSMIMKAIWKQHEILSSVIQ